jgi:flagellar basal body-associated protein FliL
LIWQLHIKGEVGMTKKKKILIFILIIVLIGIFAYTSVLSSKWKLKELTEEEKIEDFRYMYDIMKENYPHFYSIEKMYGYDWLGHKEEFEKEIRETKDNMEFFHTLKQF